MKVGDAQSFNYGRYDRRLAIVINQDRDVRHVRFGLNIVDSDTAIQGKKRQLYRLRAFRISGGSNAQTNVALRGNIHLGVYRLFKPVWGGGIWDS